MSGGRYAVYYAPGADSPWHAFATHWLGRDDITGAALAQPAVNGFEPAAFAQLTAEPRRYGFHATLRAPMRLNGSVPEFIAVVDALAARLRAVPLGLLVPVYMDGFMAVVPATRNPAVSALAEQCVQALQPLRQPLTEAERARRRPETLDARGLELLDRYGYPGVLERFRFHMTLSGPVDTATAGRLVAALAAPVSRLNGQAPAVLDRLCVFHEAEPGAPFLRVHEAVLAP